MSHLISRIRAKACQFARHEAGSVAIEYSLIAVLISVAILVAVGGVGSALRLHFYDHVVGTLEKATGGED